MAAFLVRQEAPNRYDAAIRFQQVERAWQECILPLRKRAACPPLTQASKEGMSQNWAAVCRSLDEARAALEGRAARVEDAVTVRFWPPVTAPGGAAILRASWAYSPVRNETVVIRLGGKVMRLAPGTPETAAEVDVAKVVAALKPGQQGSVGVAVQVGEQTRWTRLNVITNFEARRLALQQNASSEVAGLLTYMESGMSRSFDGDANLLDAFLLAEKTAADPAAFSKAEHIPYVQQNGTVFRLMIPAKLSQPPTLVIGLHDAGDTYNTFFDQMGQGSAVRECRMRGWIFASPQARPEAANDVLAWMRARWQWPSLKVLMIGHGAGAGLALLSGSVQPTPSAIALLSPRGGRIEGGLDRIPTYLLVGQEDANTFPADAEQLEAMINGRANGRFEWAENCGREMIAAEKMTSVFRFFDQALR